MHHFRLSKETPQDVSEHGHRLRATKHNFPCLEGMSLYKLIPHPQAVREPHWHANADELGFCTQGKVLVSLYMNGNEKETFVVSPGEAFFIPSGSLHSLENSGSENAELILQFSHEEPEDFALSSAFGMFSDAVLGNTWNLPAAYFHPLKRTTAPTFIAKLPSPSKSTQEARYTSKYQFALETSPPLIGNTGGTAQVARQNVWPALNQQALYLLTLTQQGMREPHWHPETAELGYVASGIGRMSILSPSCTVETYTMEAGDIYFIPKAYPHHIENLGKGDLKLLIFFDAPMPQDIGFSGSVKSYSNEILAATLNSTPPFFEKLPIYFEDIFIAERVNPLD